MYRRNFLKLLPAGAIMLSNHSILSAQANRMNTKKLTILHTNDWHSRIEPFPMDGSRNQGLGGAAKRAALINKIREEESNVLLFDSGDIFQGTPYFNFYAGELEFKLMSSMGYDAATIGNHDFDGGIDNLGHQLQHAEFDMLNVNYGLDQTELKGKVNPYQIFEREGIRIGVFGVGIKLEGLVPAKLYGNALYQDPISQSNKIAQHLKLKEKCDLVVCLSHLGYKYNGNYVSDVVLASKSKHIDIILGGHTHTFMKEVEEIKNLEGEIVMINQVGWAGILLGRIDLSFEKINTWKKCKSSVHKV